MFPRHVTSVFAALALFLNIVTVPLLHAAQTSVIPRDTVLRLILNNKLSTKDTKVGDRFTATLAEDVVSGGRVLARHGALVHGTVTEVERAKRLAGLTGKASMMLRFDSMDTVGGSRPMTGTLVAVHDPVPGAAEEVKKQDSKVGEEGEVKAKTDTKDIITKGAIGVAAGAALGALFGNVSRGLALGTIGGAVAILAPKGKDATLEKGSGLEVRLDRDLNVAAT